jgi:hypothetical protein
MEPAPDELIAVSPTKISAGSSLRSFATRRGSNNTRSPALRRSAIDVANARAVAASDLEEFLRALFRAVRRSGPTLRHLMAAAQSDAPLRDALVNRLIEPRRDTLRTLLEKRFPARARREAVVTAIYGAMWYRLLLDEPLDAELARELAAVLARRARPVTPRRRGR